VTPRTFCVLTLFPELIATFAGIGLARKAVNQSQLVIEASQLRDYTSDSRRTVDDVPYGGGPGMVMQVAPLRAAIREARARLPGAMSSISAPRDAGWNSTICQRCSSSRISCSWRDDMRA